jgi:DNA-3-methyladenine glycosylase
MKLEKSFYIREDVVQIAKDLLGKYLFTNIDGETTAGMIVETEAYCGATDKACHAYNRRTKRTEVMYQEGGVAYIYLCYGIHHLFNIVTHQAEKADAVLIRAIEPRVGLDRMQTRRNVFKNTPTLTAGPGVLSKALGITTAYNGTDLTENAIWIEDKEIVIEETNIIASPRVGVAYAKEDALLPWRFRIKDNKWCSKAP